MVLNIRLIDPNMTRIGSYFYSFDDGTDVMVQKADDGTIAFSYPLDSPIGESIVSLEHDGESFWTMEPFDGGDLDAGFKIRRWLIENFVMVLQQTFNFETDASDTFESSSFTIEHYTGALATGAIENTSTFSVTFNTSAVFDLITPGTRLFLGPSSRSSFVGEYEAVTVASTGPGTQVSISSPLANGFSAGDTVVFSKNIWFFNEHYQKTLDVGGLYKANITAGNVLLRQQGGAFLGINACTFYELDSFTGDFTVYNNPYLVFIRTTSLLFLDVNDPNLTVDLSAIQNNLSPDTTEVYTVYDMGIEGDTIFRLQKKFNINTDVTGPEGTHNYQLATFRAFPTSIAITATPAILPADSGNSDSVIVATVTDQYALPYVTTPLASVSFGTSGGGTGSNVNPEDVTLNDQGQATTIYETGDQAGLVTITATVNIVS